MCEKFAYFDAIDQRVHCCLPLILASMLYVQFTWLWECVCVFECLFHTECVNLNLTLNLKMKLKPKLKHVCI